jgi:hypothetical protein
MKKVIIFFTIATLLGIGIFFAISMYLSSSLTEKEQGSVDFPTSGTVSDRFTTSTSSLEVASSTEDIKPFSFTRDDVEKLVANMERMEDDEQWYSLEKNDCFELAVLGDTPFFTATLEKLPLEECQKRLQDYLMARLTITREQTCLLDLDVFAPDGNGSYRYETDMGLPGCLGPKETREATLGLH